jgi:uncharacterized membrane protein YvbJ
VRMFRNRLKYMLPIAAVLIVLVGVGVYTGIAIWNVKPTDVVDRFEAAIHKGDIDQVMDLLVSSDPLFEMNEQSAEQLVAYYRDNPLIFVNEIKQLTSSAELFEDEGVSSTSLFTNINRNSKEGLSFIQRKNSTWPSSKYAIELKLYYFKVLTNQKGTVFSLNDKEILTAKVDDYDRILGPYLPGTYEMKVDYKGDYVTLSEHKSVVLPRDHDKDIDLSLKAQYIYPESNDPEAELIVEGKSTGILFKNLNRFGPVSSDGSLTIHAEKKTEWGILSSEKVDVTAGDQYPDLSLQGVYIYPVSSYNDVKLFINDIDTGETIGYEETDGYGPLPYNATLTMHGEKVFPWGTHSSEKKPIKDGMQQEDMYLNIDAVDEKVREQIMNDMNTFIISFFAAYESNDISLVKNSTEYLNNNIVDSVNESTFIAQVTNTNYDIYSIYIFSDVDNLYNGNVTVRVMAEINNEEFASYDWSINVIYNESTNQWEANDFMDAHYFDINNSQEFTF